MQLSVQVDNKQKGPVCGPFDSRSHYVNVDSILAQYDLGFGKIVIPLKGRFPVQKYICAQDCLVAFRAFIQFVLLFSVLFKFLEFSCGFFAVKCWFWPPRQEPPEKSIECFCEHFCALFINEPLLVRDTP